MPCQQSSFVWRMVIKIGYEQKCREPGNILSVERAMVRGQGVSLCGMSGMVRNAPAHARYTSATYTLQWVYVARSPRGYEDCAASIAEVSS